jgi:hypothetical protein
MAYNSLQAPIVPLLLKKGQAVITIIIITHYLRYKVKGGAFLDITFIIFYSFCLKYSATCFRVSGPGDLRAVRTAISAKTAVVLYQTQGAGNLPPPPTGQGRFSPPFVVLVTAVTAVAAG